MTPMTATPSARPLPRTTPKRVKRKKSSKALLKRGGAKSRSDAAAAGMTLPPTPSSFSPLAPARAVERRVSFSGKTPRKAGNTLPALGSKRSTLSIKTDSGVAPGRSSPYLKRKAGGSNGGFARPTASSSSKFKKRKSKRSPSKRLFSSSPTPKPKKSSSGPKLVPGVRYDASVVAGMGGVAAVNVGEREIPRRLSLKGRIKGVFGATSEFKRRGSVARTPSTAGLHVKSESLSSPHGIGSLETPVTPSSPTARLGGASVSTGALERTSGGESGKYSRRKKRAGSLYSQEQSPSPATNRRSSTVLRSGSSKSILSLAPPGPPSGASGAWCGHPKHPHAVSADSRQSSHGSLTDKSVSPDPHLFSLQSRGGAATSGGRQIPPGGLRRHPGMLRRAGGAPGVSDGSGPPREAVSPSTSPAPMSIRSLRMHTRSRSVPVAATEDRISEWEESLAARRSSSPNFSRSRSPALKLQEDGAGTPRAKETTVVKERKPWWDVLGLSMGKLNEYSIVKEIGKGAYARVMLATVPVKQKMNAAHILTQGLTLGLVPAKTKKVAIKVMDRSFLEGSKTGGQETALDGVRREIAVMKNLSHKNVIRLEQVIDDPHHNQLFLVMKFYARGASMVTPLGGKRLPPIPTESLRTWIRDSLMGLEYCHYNNTIHRDLKPDNILITKTGNAVLADFGVADIHTGDATLRVNRGSPAFFAPEALTGAVFDGARCDLWSLGVTAYVWAFGFLPFWAGNPVQLFKAIKETPLSFPGDSGMVVPPLDTAHAGGANCSSPSTEVPVPCSDLRDLLSKLLTKDPEARPGIAELRNHPFVVGIGIDPLPEKSVNCKAIEVTEEDISCAFTSINTVLRVAMGVSRWRARSVSRNSVTPPAIAVSSPGSSLATGGGGSSPALAAVRARGALQKRNSSGYLVTKKAPPRSNLGDPMESSEVKPGKKKTRVRSRSVSMARGAVRGLAAGTKMTANGIYSGTKAMGKGLKNTAKFIAKPFTPSTYSRDHSSSKKKSVFRSTSLAGAPVLATTSTPTLVTGGKASVTNPHRAPVSGSTSLGGHDPMDADDDCHRDDHSPPHGSAGYSF